MPSPEAEVPYTAAQIRVLDDVEAVRTHPAMFIGDTGPDGLHHLVEELLDNAVDEALCGYCATIEVVLEPDGSISVSDDGRGIPVDEHPAAHRPACEVAMTVLHAGGKFDRRAYKVAGGVHGVGLSCVCGLSEHLWLDVWRDARHWTQEYSHGEVTTPLRDAGPAGDRRGTRVRFLPDAEVFDDPTFDHDRLDTRLRELAWLQPGLRLRLVDRRDDTVTVYTSPAGLAGLVAWRAASPLHDPVVLEGERHGVGVRVALLWTGGSGALHAFANHVRTPSGGTHVTGLLAAITRTVHRYAAANPPWDEAELSADDIQEGLRAAVAVIVDEPAFEAQTKHRLGNPEAQAAVDHVVSEGLAAWLEEHPAEAAAILARSADNARARVAAQLARALSRTTPVAEAHLGLPGKLSDCEGHEDTELLVVEGDSAGGSAKQGRDRHFQAVLPLRGKVLNTERATLDKVLSNKELSALVAALGCGLGADLDLSGLRYDRVVLLTDADEDGAHIRALLLTFFFRQLLPLVEAGRLYLARPPLLRISKGSQERFLQREPPEGVAALHADGWRVQRYKGLGEMTPAQLWRTTLDPARRTLVRVEVRDLHEADALFRLLMGGDAAARREWISEQAAPA